MLTIGMTMKKDKLFDDWKSIGSGLISRRNGVTIPTTMIDEDIWTKVEKNSDELPDEIFMWLQEMRLPCIIASSTDNVTKFWFVNESDATLFKITW